MNLQCIATVIINEAQFPKPVHEKANPRAGVPSVHCIFFSDDERWYGYSYERILCRLSSVTGVK